jgi:hypothetical protein
MNRRRRHCRFGIEKAIGDGEGIWLDTLAPNRPDGENKNDNKEGARQSSERHRNLQVEIGTIESPENPCVPGILYQVSGLDPFKVRACDGENTTREAGLLRNSFFATMPDSHISPDIYK